MAQVTEQGYIFNVGPELEFFLFKRDEKGNVSFETQDDAGYFDLAPDDLGETVREEIVGVLQKLGFEMEADHHEVAQGQHEIDFKYADALTTADNVMTMKAVVRWVARRHGLHATFMAKPVEGINGSGMHINQSLSSLDGENVFRDDSTEFKLSQNALYYIGGLLKHVRATTAVTNPTINSYKRLVPGYEAPVYLAWSPLNRSALCRVPAKRGSATRVELRSPDPTTNPYLAFACLVMAGLDGIKNKVEPPAPVISNIYKLSLEDRKEQGVEALPGSLYEAILELRQSKVCKEALGEHIYNEFIQVKEMEWKQYSSYVSPWETDKYLTRF
jgi:glutamine synthetase